MPAESIRVTRSVSLPIGDVRFRVSRSSGPGGQHANTSETRVEAILDLQTTTALTETQRRRAIARAGTVIRAVSQDERSQHRNRELALERVVERLRDALRVPRHRVPTAPTAAARERRLAEKRRRAALKRGRSATDDG